MLPLTRHYEPGVRLPWWVTLLDILGVLLPLLALNAYFTGGFRLQGDVLVLSVTSWQRLSFWSMVVLALRHLLVWAPTLPHRLETLWFRSDERGWRGDVLAIGLGTRLAVLLLGSFAVLVIGGPSDTVPPPVRWSWTLPPGSEGWRHLAVARGGYPAMGLGAAVFPALGLLMRWSEWLLGISPATAGLVIAVLSFVAAMAYLYKLARQYMDHDAALVAMALLAASPWSWTHSLVDVEPLYLLAAVGAFWHVRRGEWWRASAWGLLLGLARPGGFLMALPLALAARTRAPEPRAARSAGLSRSLPAAAPLIGLLIALVYAGGWTRIFGTTPSPAVLGASGLLGATGWPAQLLTQGLLPSVATAPMGVLDTLSAAAAVALVWPVWRRLGFPYGLFVVLALLSSLLFSGEASPGRQTAVLFPLFLWMGTAVPLPQRFAWVSLFAMMQALAAVLFFTWRGQW